MNTALPLILSLGVNLVLVAAVVNQLGKPASPAPEPAGIRAEGAAAPVTIKVVSRDQSPPSAPVAGFHWRMLESEDYRQYVANLRAVKCPEQTVQDIVYADLERLVAKKFRAVNLKHKINRDASLSDYWKSDDEFTRAKVARDAEGGKCTMSGGKA
jgi:hypothetical protein